MEIVKTYRPKRGVFESTLACNLKCRHCGSSAGKARADELSTEECASLFTQLKDIGLSWLTISGGEPMSRPDWAKLIELATSSGLRVGMFTNAISLDDEAARRAKDSGIQSIGLSIDGLEATHDRIRGKQGHFKVLETAMDHLRKHQIPFSAITTICNDNLPQLEELNTYIAAQGAYNWQVQLGSDMGNLSHYPEMLISPKQLPKLEQRLANMIVSGPLKIYPADSLGYFGPNEKILRSPTGGHCFSGCGAGTRNIGIESNGNIKGCLSIMAGYNKEGKNYVEGNIRNEPLADIWNRPGAFAYNREWKTSNLGGFCAQCTYSDKCRGGCMGKRISDGNLKDNPMCTYRVLLESSAEPRKIAQAAAVFFAVALGASNTACDNTDDPSYPNGTNGDTVTSTSVDTDTSTDTSMDTSIDTNIEQTTELYGIQPDTEVDTLVPPYGLPDSETDYPVDAYGIQPEPDIDSATELNTPVTIYGIMAVKDD